jgi:hypothetical protein
MTTFIDLDVPVWKSTDAGANRAVATPVSAQSTDSLE